VHLSSLPHPTPPSNHTHTLTHTTHYTQHTRNAYSHPRRLGEQLAALHLNDAHAPLHKGRFGFAVSNFLALTPLNNTWDPEWPRFFARRLEAQVTALQKEKQYGRAALNATDTELVDLGMRVRACVTMRGVGRSMMMPGGQKVKSGEQARVIRRKRKNTHPHCLLSCTHPMIRFPHTTTRRPHHTQKKTQVVNAVPSLLAGVTVTPSLIHGDLWVGNAGATESDGPVIFDPACFFGHHEMELAMMTLFGGFREEFWSSYHKAIPKAPGFEGRHKLYQLYYYLNQLNLFGDAGVKATCLRLANELLMV
jgi:fructosamine-3-kinase